MIYPRAPVSVKVESRAKDEINVPIALSAFRDNNRKQRVCASLINGGQYCESYCSL